MYNSPFVTVTRSNISCLCDKNITVTINVLLYIHSNCRWNREAVTGRSRDAGKHLTLPPSKFWDSRPEYKDYCTSAIRQHIYQETKLRKYYRFRSDKKNNFVSIFPKWIYIIHVTVSDILYFTSYGIGYTLFQCTLYSGLATLNRWVFPRFSSMSKKWCIESVLRPFFWWPQKTSPESR